MKLVVEVLDASDLMPKDGQGSASPFVEVDFDQQRQRTQTKHKDLNPSWNEKLVFAVSDPSRLPDQTIDVVVHNDRRSPNLRTFLGRVRISGFSVPESESLSSVQRYPLDKRGLFSRIRGDIALRIYAVPDALDPPIAPPSQQQQPPNAAGIAENFNFNANASASHGGGADGKKKSKNKSKSSSEAKEAAQTFYSIPSTKAAAAAGAAGPSASGFDFFKPQPPPPAASAAMDEKKAQHAVPAGVHVIHGPPTKKPEFELQETFPQLPGRLRRMGVIHHDKTASTYDLVEPMEHLYVSVVKAKDLPTMDITGSLDPYVIVKLGNFLGITKHFEKNQSPVWNQTFAFSKDHYQSSQLEVIVKDKDMVKDDFVGKVTFELPELPHRAPPDSPLAPQWYKLVDKKGDKAKGEIMLAVWKGTQADDAYPSARHSDTLNLSHEAVSHTRSQVYYSPKLYYLRVQVIAAQDLVPSDKDRVPDPYVRVHVGNQDRFTKTSRSVNPVWNEELLFVVSERYSNEYLIITVEDRLGPQKSETLGRLNLPGSTATVRLDHTKVPPPRWFNLDKPSAHVETEGEKKKDVKFSSKIHLHLILDAGYHVLDESTHFSSDLQPSAKTLRKPSIGFLELGILSGMNLAMKNTYCVAKYGSKWIRTRTLLETHSPRWNEQYTWEVFDPCTVLTVAVFDNSLVFGKKEEGAPPPKDKKIGKLRIRLSTLETDRIYTHTYPLLVLQPPPVGLKKMGDLHLALRFTCTAWVNMVALYSRPLLPKMHYVQTIPPHQTDILRVHAIHIVAERLSRSEPPLRPEAVEYMLDKDSHMWSFRRSKANFARITTVLSGFAAVGKWFDDVRNWKNPITTILVHVLFLILICYPELILPTMFLYLFLIGIWNYRSRPRKPPSMDAALSLADRTHPDELDEEFDTFPTTRPADLVRMRYDRLRSVMGRMQTVLGDLATQGERAQALLSWRDPRATAIFVLFSLVFAVVLYVTPFQIICVIAGLYLLRHPRFRSKKMPSVPFNFYKRLPSKSDQLI